VNQEKEKLERNVRRAAGVSALRKIGKIVAEEQQADNEKASALKWFFRYGWIVLVGCALSLAHFAGWL